ncbi:MAG: hypothetical protein JXR49_10370 [Acidobacteria bacterium]|nr:hypothetical protein [Acidobacteriota bacterium]
MFNRKHVYILLAVVFAAAVVLIFIRTFIAEDPSGAEVVISLEEDGGTAKVVPDQDAAGDDKGPTDVARSGGKEHYSLVTRLLNNFQKRQVFGSFRIISVIVHETVPESSRATIEDMQTGSSRTYFINDTLPDDSQLVNVKEDYIVLQKNGVRKRIYFNSPNGNAGGKKLTGNRRSGFQKINDNEFNLSPYRVFRGDAASVLDFSMKVHSRDGEMDGIQVSDMEQSALFRTLGLEEGDVLVEVNSKPVDSLLGSVKACINAYYSDDVQLKIRRGDEIITLTYHLYWEGQGSWTPMDVFNSRAVSSLFDGGLASHLF